MFQNCFRRCIIGACIQQEAQSGKETAPAGLQKLLETRLKLLTALVALEVFSVDKEGHRSANTKNSSKFSH
jgi:hypothetical protein